jgi:D-amino peptidase
VRGVRAGGATEIVVMDCHGAGGEQSFNSLRPDLLDEGCEFVVQKVWTEYTGVLEDGCDAALFVGDACDGRHRRRADEPHGLGHRMAQRQV